MSESARRTAVVIGAGPGLGMSVAHRFGREGYAVALISRNADRHAGYLASLRAAGVEASAHAADVRADGALVAALDAVEARHGRIDLMYYGAAAVDLGHPPVPITETDAAAIKTAMGEVYPAVDAARRVLPGMLARGSGGLLFAGGASAITPMPMLGSLAVTSAALRNYAVTLHAALAARGVYAGTLTIGGLIERGDIHAYVRSRPEQFGAATGTLDPDEIAEAAWRLYADRDRAEAVFSALP